MKKYILVLSLGFFLTACNFFGKKEEQIQPNPIINTGSENVNTGAQVGNTGSENINTGVQVKSTGSVILDTGSITNSGEESLTGISLSGTNSKEVEDTMKEINELIDGIK